MTMWPFKQNKSLEEEVKEEIPGGRYTGISEVTGLFVFIRGLHRVEKSKPIQLGKRIYKNVGFQNDDKNRCRIYLIEDLYDFLSSWNMSKMSLCRIRNPVVCNGSDTQYIVIDWTDCPSAKTEFLLRFVDNDISALIASADSEQELHLKMTDIESADIIVNHS